MIKRIWIVFKTLIAAATVLTLITFFLYLLPGVVQMEVMQEHSWVPNIFVVVVLFWCVYLIKWIGHG